jgi:hypothetical protein
LGIERPTQFSMFSRTLLLIAALASVAVLSLPLTAAHARDRSARHRRSRACRVARRHHVRRRSACSRSKTKHAKLKTKRNKIKRTKTTSTSTTTPVSTSTTTVVAPTTPTGVTSRAGATTPPATTTTTSVAAPTTTSVSTAAPTSVSTTAPTTGKASAAGTSTPAGQVLFNGSSKSAWHDESASANRIVAAPETTFAAAAAIDGDSDPALQFTADNGDVYPLTPTGNPRAQLSTPTGIVRQGTPFWESYEFYLPLNFPVSETYGGWVALGSPFYGAPSAGTPPTEISLNNGEIRFMRDGHAPSPYQTAWEEPIVLGQWIRITWHIMPSTNGWVQLYVNGVPVSLYNGSTSSTTLDMPLVDPTNDVGPWYSQMSVYYKLNEFSALTIDFRDFKIATTQTAAAN